MGWMLRGLDDDTRPFVGRDSIRREVAGDGSRWATVGIVVDWQHWDRLHREAGLLPPKDEHPPPYEQMLYDPDGEHAGYVTSFVYSPVLQRHIGLARVRPTLGAPGTGVRMEVVVNHRTTTVEARTASLPLFNPPRKTAKA
jgi:aminomethyltransferase